MKSLKRFAKHTALVFAVLLSMYSCQKDDAVTLESNDSHQHEHSSTTKSVSASEIPRVMQFLESKSNARLEVVIYDTNSELGMNRSHEENLSMTTALVDQIKMVTNSYGRSNYTFKLIEEETRAGVYFLNLIVKEHKDEFYVFIMKYVPSEAWLNTFTDTSSFSSYSGDIYFYDHNGVYAGRTTLVNGQTTTSDSREPCPPDIDHNSPTGGGNASATTGTASGVSSSTSSSTGTSGGSLEDLTANFGWLCNWWGELHQNPQECHNPAAGGSWTIQVDYGNEDRSMRDLTDCPRVSGECYQSNGDPCPNGCDEDGYCIDEQEEIESSEIDINVDVALARYNNFYGDLTSEQQGFLDAHSNIELDIQQFLSENGFRNNVQNQLAQIISSIMNETLLSFNPFVRYPMNLVNQYRADYPYLTEYLENQLPTVSNIPLIINTINEITSIEEEQIIEDLQWGYGPKIHIVQLDNFGDNTNDKTVGFFRAQDSDIIYLDIDYVNGLENGTTTQYEKDALLFYIGVVILHEYVHYADNIDGVDYPGEEGIIFEVLVYGEDVNSSNAALILNRE